MHGNYIVSTVDNFSSMFLTYRETQVRINLDTCKQMLSGFGDEIPRMREIIKGNPEQEQIVKNLSLLYDTLQRDLKIAETLPLTDTEKWNALMADVWKTGPLTRTEIQLIIGQESRAASTEHTSKAGFREQIKILVIAATIVDILVAIVLVLYFFKHVVRRLDVLTQNSLRLGQELPLIPELKGKDEIGNLDKVFHDMAEALTEARRKERALVENTVDVICSISPEGQFLNVNIACQKMWGYEKESLQKKNFVELIAKDDQKRMQQSLKELVNSETDASIEAKVVKSDGNELPTSWTVSWSPVENALFCVVHDITERKQVERLKQEFVAMVSHDLRTPLASLHGGLLILGTGKHGDLTEKGKRFVDNCTKSVDRLMKLINDLLDAEKLEAGKFDMDIKEMLVNDAIERSITEVKSLADKSGVTLVADDVEFSAYADEERLVQVLVNLLGNSIKFSPAGGTITISVVEELPWIEISVLDQGPGIPTEYQQSIFDKFKQLPGTQKKGSTGLGLAICKTIIEQHGGTIGVSSELGKGSRFWFRIPSAS